MSEITGYIDRDIVKGHTYRLAGCPVPTVFTGDIDIISDDILVKAMLVVNDGTRGTFPTDGAFTYLVNTIEYGNSTYLQTAVNCSDRKEYRRIKSGSSDWTKWLSASDAADEFSNRIGTLETTINGNDSVVGLTSRTKDLEDRVTNGYNTSDGFKSGLITRVDTIEKAGYGTSISNLNTALSEKIKQVVLTQNVSSGTSGEVFKQFQLNDNLVYPVVGTKTGILISMRADTKWPGAAQGVTLMLIHAENGARPYINLQKGPGVTFDKEFNFIFTFYIP
jgi:hypothetical protein